MPADRHRTQLAERMLQQQSSRRKLPEKGVMYVPPKLWIVA
jgi:hypothetical protein